MQGQTLYSSPGANRVGGLLNGTNCGCIAEPVFKPPIVWLID